MRSKKITAIIILLIIIISQLAVIPINSLIYAVDDGENEYRYFYNQFTEDSAEQRIYNAMYKMYKDDILKKGEDFDLIANGYVTEAEVEAYTSGSNALLNAMGAARDAFQYDFPDVFYVDFSAISLRVTRSTDGTYHAYLGSGRRDTYYMPGFSADNIDEAIKKYEKAIEDIVEKAKDVEPKENYTKEQITYVHNYITTNMIYRFEDEVTNGNARTAYDCLVYGEGVCESYTRGFKAVMDRLNIPCICVYGAYKVSDTQTEEHIWNYVQVDGEWFGVDVTHDDPIVSTSQDKKSGHETEEFLLVGEIDLASHHIPSGILSEANYEFKYPGIQIEALRGEKIFADEDLKVKLIEATYDEGDGELLESGTMKVSYQGKNYTQNASQGKYIIAKLSQYYPGTDEWLVGDWCYLTPELYDVKWEWEPEEQDEELGSYIQLPMPHIKKAQFAITDIAPDTSTEGILNGGLFYKGDPSLLTIKTEEIENVWGGDYVAPPYPKKITPYMSGKLFIGETYHVTAIYDDKLIPVEGENFDIELTSYTATGDSNASTGATYSKIENLSFDGESTITFDFTPSQMYADDCCYYNIHIKGLVGSRSGKSPIDLSYMAGYRCAVCCYKAQGIDWNVFGQPRLLETGDVATTGWQDSDGNSVNISDKITHRLTLVTTKPSEAQSKQMNDLLESEFNSEDGNIEKAEVLESETYNIKLTLCKKQIIRTGEKVRVSVGFPAGYGPNDEGVTFKAYHYITDPNTGKIIDVEEIECVVTQYGLIIMVDAFSPFTIAAVKSEETTEDNSKIVILSSTEGGKVTSTSGEMIKLDEEKKEANITIEPNEGYEIEKIAIGGKVIPANIDESGKMSYTLNYDNLDSRENIVKVDFVSSEVLQKEEEKGETIVEQILTPAEISFGTDLIMAKTGETLVLEPTITGEGIHNYEWYKKVGNEYKKLEGKNDKTLTIENITPDDIGEYKLIVTTILDTASVKSEGTVNVTLGALTSSVYNITEEAEGNYVTITKPGTTISEFLENVTSGLNVYIINQKGDIIEDNTLVIGTGMKVKVGENLEYTVVVTGDLTGDGLIKNSDLLMLAQYRVDLITKLDNVVLRASDVNQDGKCAKDSDLLKIARILVDLE